jgi:putative ABC transport system ATP-binding protein
VTRRATADAGDVTTDTVSVPLISVVDVGRVHGSGPDAVTVLADVSFDVPAATLFAVNGASGSGKSTLLNLLTGIDRPSGGTVTVAGTPVAGSENALARWRGRNVGIVFQSFLLIPTLTAVENVRLALELADGRRAGRRARALECLDAVEMAGFAARLPGQLSGGQQQRVAIARALANDPPLIVADEPTGNLDTATAASVFALLEALPRTGRTVVYVTHDPALAARADASIDLRDGRIVARRARGERVGAA